MWHHPFVLSGRYFGSVSISSWILLSLAFIVTAVLAPQVAKSRRMMGQARNDDRFSQGVRLLDVEEMPNEAHSVEVTIHRQTDAATMQKLATRPIKMAQDLRTFTDLKSQRAGAVSARAAQAHRRSVLLTVLVVFGILISVLAASGILSWWVLFAPGSGAALTLVWGSIAASRGRQEDLNFLTQIRQVERRLEKSPAGRAALTLGKKRDNHHWAKVAAQSLSSENQHEGTLEEALAQARKATAAQTKDAEEIDQQVQSENTVDAPMEDSVEEIRGIAEDSSEAASNPGTTPQTDEKSKWEPSEIPAPNYTLQSGNMRFEVQVDDALTGGNWEESPVPMRPKTAAVLPTGESQSSEEVADNVPLDLESILERRRAAGD